MVSPTLVFLGIRRTIQPLGNDQRIGNYLITNNDLGDDAGTQELVYTII